MAEYLGTVRNIAAGRSMLDLHVYDDGILVGRGDLKSMMLKMTVVARQAGDDLDRRREGSIAATDRDDLLAMHKENRFIPSDSIRSVRYSHPWFPPIYRIDLDFADGKAERFEWKRLHNEPKAVADILRRAYGERLTTERI